MKKCYFGKILLLIGIIMALLFIVSLYEPKKQTKIYRGETETMKNEVVLIGKVAYYPIFAETKDLKIGKIGVLVVENKDNMTSFDIIECEGDPQEIEKYSKSDKVIIHGKLKNDNNKLKVVITKIEGE